MWILAALLAASPLSVHDSGPLLQIELERGRGELATRAGVRALSPALGTIQHGGAGYLYVAAASRAAVHFTGVGSLTIEGPTEFEWFAELGAGGDWVWHLPRLKEVQLETRRGGVRLDLPDGWRLDTGAGALWLHQRPSGAVDLNQDAGYGFVLVPPTPSDMASPPLAVAPGARLRLHRRALASLGWDGSPAGELWSPERVRANARPSDAGRPWGAFAWPWEAPAAASVDDAGAPLTGLAPSIQLLLVAPPLAGDWQASDLFEGALGPLTEDPGPRTAEGPQERLEGQESRQGHEAPVVDGQDADGAAEADKADKADEAGPADGSGLEPAARARPWPQRAESARRRTVSGVTPTAWLGRERAERARWRAALRAVPWRLLAEARLWAACSGRAALHRAPRS